MAKQTASICNSIPRPRIRQYPMEPTVNTTRAQVRLHLHSSHERGTLTPFGPHGASSHFPLTHTPASKPKIAAFARALLTLSQVALSERIEAEIADAMQAEYRCLREAMDRYEEALQQPRLSPLGALSSSLTLTPPPFHNSNQLYCSVQHHRANTDPA
jgi:hypothetical protein